MINKATCNVTFGLGGPFILSKAFSKKNISFIPFHDLSVIKPFIIDPMMITENSLVTTIDELKDALSI